MIAGNAIETATGEACTAKDIAAANHQRDLDPHLDEFSHLAGHTAEDVGIDAEVTVAHQGFAAQFEEDSSGNCVVRHENPLVG